MYTDLSPFQLQSPSASYGDLKDLEKYGDRPVVDNKAAIFGSITRVRIRLINLLFNCLKKIFINIFYSFVVRLNCLLL